MDSIDAIVANVHGGEAAVRIISAASDSNDRNINQKIADEDGAKECSSLIEEMIDDGSKNISNVAINNRSLSSLIEVASSNCGPTRETNPPPAMMLIKSEIAVDDDQQGHAEEGIDHIITKSQSNINPYSTTSAFPLYRLSLPSGGASFPAQPAAAGTANNDDNESPTSTRIVNHKYNTVNSERCQNIIASIRHRQKLLSWVRACRIESQSVLRELSEVRDGGRRGFIGAILMDYSSQEHSIEAQQQQQQGVTVQPPLSPRGDASSSAAPSAASEIADFQTITEMANLPPPSLKRIRTSSIVEKNPRDLRRGVSVGKSMSNAESSLNHVGGGGASTTSSVGNGSILHLGPGGGEGWPAILPPSSRLSAANTAKNSATSYQTSPNIHNPTINNTVGKQFHKLPSSKVLNSLTTCNDKLKKGRKRKASYGDSDGMATLPGGAAQAKYPLISSLASAASQKGTLPTNNTLLSPMNTLVPSLAAVNLLRRKDGLMSRLDSLLNKQRRVVYGQRIPPTIHADDGGAGRNADSDKSTPTTPTKKLNNDGGRSSAISRGLSVFAASTNNMSNQKMSVPSPPYIGGKFGAHPKVSSLSGAGRHPQQLQLHRQPPPPPQRLPLRRKTHWDCVLDEMKWMATDFHEERKWKMAAGTTLSSAVRRHKPKKKSLAISMGATPTKRMYGSWGASVSTSSSRSTPKSFELTSLDSNNVNSNNSDTDSVYVDASSEDVESVKKISRLMSVSILDYWDFINTSRYEDQKVGQQRLHRLKEVSSLSDDALEIVQSMESNGRVDEWNRTKDNKSQCTNSCRGFSPSTSPRRELGFGEISSLVKSSIKVVNALKEQTVKALLKEQTYQRYKKSMLPPTSSGMLGVELDDGQLHAVHFLESLWETTINSNSGSCYGECTAPSDGTNQTETSSLNDDATCRTISAIVGGDSGIGKTVAVCVLLWKNRNNGPQLIVCSPGALIRWRHELRKFDCLNAKIYFRGDGYVGITAADIVVCDYGSFLELAGRSDHSSSGQTKIDFASMILDLRHPCSSTRDKEFGQNKEIKPEKSTPLVESVRWWIRLNDFLAKRSTDMKRLVIEQTDLPQSCLFLPKGINSSSAELTKRFDELLAMKVAFFYHPAIFFSESGSVGKRVISWAKSEAKKKISIKVTAHGVTLAHILYNGFGALPSCGLRSVLTASLKNVCDSLVGVMRVNEDEANYSTNKLAWQLRVCSLAKPQQDAYEQSFSNLGGPYDEIAGGLLKLRKICIHSNLDQILVKILNPLSCHGFDRRHGVGKHGSILVRNSRFFLEPSIDVARKVMKKSSKMKELLSVLIYECGFEVAGKFDLVENPIDVGEDKMSADEAPKKKPKVLILATLVEAQLLTSYFLSAVGLHHEVLISTDANDHDQLHFSSRGSEMAWTWSQDVLSRFNNSSASSQVHRSINVLISSPKTISSHSGGIGAASADTVISIDEDWSGREAIHIKSIMSKIHRHQIRTLGELASSLSKSPLKFFKLVCHNTCEETFLCNGIMKEDTDRRKHEKETQQQCKIGTRRSSRQSKRTLIANQDEALSGTAKDSHDRPIKMQSPDLFCPTRMIHTANSINFDGFLVPPAIGDDEQPLTKSDESYAAGSNTLSFTTATLSSTLCSQKSCHHPSKYGQKYIAMTADRSVAFKWALFNTEERASSVSNASAGLTAVNLELRSISVNLTATTIDSSSYIRRYAESFRRSPSFIHHGRSEKPMPTLNNRLSDGDGSNIHRNSSSSAYSNSISKEHGKKEATSDINNATLLIYSVPNASKLKFPVDESTPERGQRRDVCLSNFNPHDGHSTQNILSFCLSSFNSSSSALPQDGNQGCEPFAYFPAFLSDLSQGNTLRRLTGKESESKFIDAVVETSQYSYREDRNEYGNAELTFHRRLLAADLQGALSCQQRPSLNCMILINQKKRQLESNASMAGGIVRHIPSSDSSLNNAIHPVKKSSHKKIKRHHLPDSLSTQDKGINSYFRNEHLLTRVFSVRDGIKFNISASAMGRVRSQSRLNDLVSKSFRLSFINSNQPPVEAEHQNHLSVLIPMRSNGSVLLGTIPRVDVGVIHQKEKYLTGITLPLGVKPHRLSNKISSSLEKFEDPWSGTEDSALQQCVLRYGLNWQLAANAVSSGMTFSPSCFAEWREGEGGGAVRRRSAVQCQNRWMALESSKVHISPPPSPPIATTSLGDHYNSATVPTDRVIPLFLDEIGGLGDGASLIKQSNQGPNQNGSLLWLGTTNLAPAVSDLSLISNENEKRLAILSRVQLLNAASKKRRVAKTPLPSSTQAHSSHSEAIQAARASMLSAANGVAPPRHEMWPLELLDFRKQHNATANQNIPRGPAPHSTHPPSQSPHRQQGSAPHHPPHTVHPPQPQIYHVAGQMPPQHPPYHHQKGHPNVAYQAPQQRHQH